MSTKKLDKKTVVGWSEYIDIPLWGVSDLKAKVDTGARTSALDVKNLKKIDEKHVSFDVIVRKAKPRKEVSVVAEVIKWAKVRSSTGRYTKRPFVKTEIVLGSMRKEIEVTLVAREEMLFRMLIGRKALEHDFIVDVSKRSVHGKPRRIK